MHLGFPDSSVSNESTCNAGDPGSIPVSGRSAGEWIGYPLQYTWASLVAQLVKNLPAMQETWVWSLGWEDFPGEGKGYPLQYSDLENSMDCRAHGVTKSQTQLGDFILLRALAEQESKRAKNLRIWFLIYFWSIRVVNTEGERQKLLETFTYLFIQRDIYTHIFREVDRWLIDEWMDGPVQR